MGWMGRGQPSHWALVVSDVNDHVSAAQRTEKCGESGSGLCWDFGWIGDVFVARTRKDLLAPVGE